MCFEFLFRRMKPLGCFQAPIFVIALTLFSSPAASAGGLPHIAVESYARMPMSFETNLGQAGASATFVSRGPGYSLSLFPNRAVLRSARPGRVAEDKSGRAGQMRDLRFTFEGAIASSPGEGEGQLSHRSNYFIGNDPAKWLIGVPNYRRVRYKGIYPGIDVVYYGNQAQLIVAPGGNPNAIRIFFEGAKRLSLDSKGNLIVETAAGTAVQNAPRIYQTVRGSKQEIGGRYAIVGKDRVAFQIERYDPSESLIIDPVLSYATYLGGSGTEQGYGIAVDSAGSVYVTGLTTSTNFPALSRLGPGGGFSDALVAKISSDGSRLEYAAYLGGSGYDAGLGITVDSAGNAYVTGTTGSTDFPTVAPLQPTLRGLSSLDAFVAKLSPSGVLLYSTYLGGTRGDDGGSIGVDASGYIYVAGHTTSTDFPVANAFQPAFGGETTFGDLFLSKLNPAGSALIYSTYLGGRGSDAGSLAIDAAGNAYVAGSTSSDDFPTHMPLQPARRGIRDAFAAKFSPSGAVLYSTYLGGSGLDAAGAIATDSAGNAYMAGSTDSTDFPTLNPFQREFAGGTADGFVLKLNASGSALVFSTYLGGGADESISGIALDLSGNAYVAGRTNSANFPVTRALQSALDMSGGSVCSSIFPCYDGFVAKVDAGGSRLVYSSYLGGSRDDWIHAIAVDAKGAAYLFGSTDSPDLRRVHALQSALAGGTDAFVVKVEDGTSLYFAHFVNGTSSGVSFRNQITLVNLDSASPASASIEIRDDGGNPMAVALDGTIVAGRKDVTIPPSGLATLRTDGLGPLQVGSVVVTADLRIAGFMILGSSLGEVGIGSSFPLRKIVVPVETGAGVNTGIALMGLGQAQAIQLELRDGQGNLRATASLALGANSHLARFVTELPWNTAIDFSNFIGTIAAKAAQDFAAVALRLGPGGFTSLPVAEQS